MAPSTTSHSSVTSQASTHGRLGLLDLLRVGERTAAGDAVRVLLVLEALDKLSHQPREGVRLGDLVRQIAQVVLSVLDDGLERLASPDGVVDLLLGIWRRKNMRRMNRSSAIRTITCSQDCLSSTKTQKVTFPALDYGHEDEKLSKKLGERSWCQWRDLDSFFQKYQVCRGLSFVVEG